MSDSPETNPCHQESKTPRLVLQINSVSAVERLLAGDPKMEIEIRDNIIRKLIENSFKNLAEKWAIAHADVFNKAVADSFSTLYPKIYNRKTGEHEMQLTEKQRKGLKEALDKEVARQIQEEVYPPSRIHEKLDLRFASLEKTAETWARQMQEKIEQVWKEFDKRIDALVQSKIEAAFDKQVNAAVERRLKEIKEAL